MLPGVMAVLLDLALVLELVGDLSTDAGSRERFDRYIRQHLVEPGQVRRYAEAAAQESPAQQRGVIKALVHLVGHRLGFEVDGEALWRAPGDHPFVVRIFPREAEVEAQGRVLYVVQRGEAQKLEAAVLTASRQPWQRIVSLDDLLYLWDLQQRARLTPAQVQVLLWPAEGATATALLEVVDAIARGEARPPLPSWALPLDREEQVAAARQEARPEPRRDRTPNHLL